jgi:hypothetical protein
MAHPHNPDWPDGYKPSMVEIHVNFARLIVEGINDDIIVDPDSMVDTLDLLDECATFGCALVPDFTGVSRDGYFGTLEVRAKGRKR